MAKNTVVTYTQANGRPATTVVTPAQKAALKASGRLVADHGTGKNKK